MVDVYGVDELVDPRPKVGDVDVLALDLRLVVVAVADGDPFPNSQDPRALALAEALPDLRERLALQATFG